MADDKFFGVTMGTIRERAVHTHRLSFTHGQ